MKKIFLFVALSGITLLTNAQVSFGPVVGIGAQGPRSMSYSSGSSSTTVITNFQGQEVSRDYDYNPGNPDIRVYTTGFSYNFGLQAKIDLGKYVALSPSLIFQHLSSKYTSYNYGSNYGPITGKQSMNYIAIPVIVQGQYPINDQITVGLGIGPQFNFLVGGKGEENAGGLVVQSKLKPNSKIDEAEARTEVAINNDPDMSNDIAYTKPVIISLNIAPFVQFKFGGMSLLISPTYYIGLTNILPATKYTTTETQRGVLTTRTTYRSVDEKPVSRTGGFGFNVALLFGGNK